jgi:putative membrane protein
MSRRALQCDTRSAADAGMHIARRDVAADGRTAVEPLRRRQLMDRTLHAQSHAPAQLGPGGASTELSARRTGMSFQRTRLSAERTLMSVIRTALSLIGFGFTIFQFFEKLKEAGTLAHAAAPRNFGIALVLLGIGILFLGISYHVQFMLGLRRERTRLKEEGLIHAESRYPVSYTLLTALALLLIGVFAIASMVFRIGPFG